MPDKNKICLWYEGAALDAARFYPRPSPTAPSERSIVRRATIPTASRGMSCGGVHGDGHPVRRTQWRAGDQAQRGVLVSDRDRRPGRNRPPVERDRANSGKKANAVGVRTSGACPGRSRRSVLLAALFDPDPAAAKRAFEAMMPMKKIDIVAIEAARRAGEALGRLGHCQFAGGILR